MKIPADAIIAPEKLTQYLLVWQPKKDKSKFLALAGFTFDNPQDLEASIRQILETNEAVFEKENEFGQYFQVEGDLIGTNKRILGVITIWILKTSGNNKFHFVTLKPGRSFKHDET